MFQCEDVRLEREVWTPGDKSSDEITEMETGHNSAGHRDKKVKVVTRKVMPVLTW